MTPGFANGRTRRATWRSAAANASAPAKRRAGLNTCNARARTITSASVSCSRRARRGSTPTCEACSVFGTPQHTPSGRVSSTEIPYKGASLPAIYVHAEPQNRAGKVPAIVFFDGLDVTKEIQYFKGVADLVARGIACLIVEARAMAKASAFVAPIYDTIPTIMRRRFGT